MEEVKNVENKKRKSSEVEIERSQLKKTKVHEEIPHVMESRINYSDSIIVEKYTDGKIVETHACGKVVETSPDGSKNESLLDDRLKVFYGHFSPTYYRKQREIEALMEKKNKDHVSNLLNSL